MTATVRHGSCVVVVDCATATAIRGCVPPRDRFIDQFRPWVSYGVAPACTLGNAGIILTSQSVSTYAAVLSVFAALAAAKSLCRAMFSRLSAMFSRRRRADCDGWIRAIGIAALAGIAFTVSLFATRVVVEFETVQTGARIGVVAGLLVGAMRSVALTVRTREPRSTRQEHAMQPNSAASSIRERARS